MADQQQGEGLRPLSNLASAIASADRARAVFAELQESGENKTGMVLGEPQCERGCPACRMDCAIAQILAQSWEKEVARLGGRADALSHGGVVYAGTVGNA